MSEMKIDFFKASASADNNNCVELGETMDGRILVRDSKQGGRGPVLSFTKSEIAAMLTGAKMGEFDHLI